MKKVILAMVFIFATGAMMSSTNILNDVCWDNAESAVYFAEIEATPWYGFGGLSYEESYDVFEEAYDSYLGNWQ
jgi:hypothetical protein